MSEDSNASGSQRPNVLSLNITEVGALQAAYIPQLRHGGIFIPTNRTYHLGDEVFMLLMLPDDTVKLPVAGKVVWITPDQAQGKKAQGVGVQFSPDEAGRSVKRKIESILLGAPDQDAQTHTL